MVFSLFLALSFLLTTTTPTTTFCHASSLMTDFHALISLKQGFHFHNTELESWDSSNPGSVCSWNRIRCSGFRVVSLDLSDLNLSGYLNSLYVSMLDELITLSLNGNNFTGEFRISNLRSLRFLNISNNQFHGDLDWDFQTISSLQVFDIYNNNFSGFLPGGVLRLSQTLRVLNLCGNFFKGQIPPSYGQLIKLEYLLLGGNDLRGQIPPEIGNLTNLKEIYLGDNNVFEGGIPVEFGKLVNLVRLDLPGCGLTGSIPRELGNLKLLDTLYLYNNLLSGSIPRELGNLTNLVELDLSRNVLTGEIPSEFVNLKKLKVYKLMWNRLHGSIPDYVADLLDLETFGLWQNNFTGMIPQKLGQKGRLKEIDLSSNKLTGTIPEGLCGSNRLTNLILMNNFLFGQIPESLGRCYSLTKVRLGNNYLNGSLPGGLVYLPEMVTLQLNDNYLSGPLSENGHTSSRPVKLQELNLLNNRLTGFLPNSLSDFSSTETISLGGNQFSGPIPVSVGKLEQVIKLDLSRNFITGPIPAEIGNCLHLSYLDLSQNNLSGSIPPEISNIPILNYLNLSRNHLNETLPGSIGSMKSLVTADFSFNDLSGKLPEFGQFLVFNASSFAGNPRICASLLNNPCNISDISDQPRKSRQSLKLVFALALLICFLVFATIAILKAKSIKRKDANTWKMTVFQKLEFTVVDVLGCVKDGNVIGRGGAGVVYHGKVPSGVEIAVKKLLTCGTKSHDHGFKAEIQTLGNIRHRNIVRLVAFCSNKETNLLVYEYMRNGSLGEALHGKKGSFLGWSLRYKIAIEAAKGLCYLHHDCSPLIVHRDVKSNNILLDSSFEAHVADFGLAKFLEDGGGTTECMSAIAGSYGYIAPEYAYTLKVDEKSDVYSYGVVLLELLTGRRPVGEFGEGVDIVQWVKSNASCCKNDVTSIIDHRLTTVPKEEAKHLFFIAMLCVQENSVQRPNMREVVQMLAELQAPCSSKPESKTNGCPKVIR